MDEIWKDIEEFPEYAVSNYGRVRTNKTGRVLSLSETQFGLVNVGLMRDGTQYHRSVPLLVAKAFLPVRPEPFDTPINLDGDRHNNHVNNLVWRPRWFAIKYNRQFRYPYHNPILHSIVDQKSGEVFKSSFDAAITHGLLEEDVVLSTINKSYVWPTYQEFRILRV